MVKPNFLIIGTAKAGTTSLYKYLKQHPQVYMSPNKEPNFFMQEGDSYDNTSGSQKHQLIADIETYYSLFQGLSNEIAIGEASTQYLFSHKAPICIQKYLPDVKLIAVLRNPVDRAYSGFLHNVGQIPEPVTSFSKALQNRKSKGEDIIGNSIQMGFYFEQLQRYFDLFDRQQIRVYLYEDFQRNPMSLLKNIFQFLEVDDTFLPDISAKQHISRVYKNKVLYLLSKTNLVKSSIKLLMPQQLFHSLKNKNLARPQKLTLQIRKQLLEEYRSDIIKLQDLLQQDLSIWLVLEENHENNIYQN